MQKFILTIIVISNVCVGFEVASDYEDAWAEFGGLMTVTDLPSDLTDGGDIPDGETECDHCCHGVAHFAGAVGDNVTVPFMGTSSAIPLSDTVSYFIGRSPPTPPPNA